jgi:hypothetical protein
MDELLNRMAPNRAVREGGAPLTLWGTAAAGGAEEHGGGALLGWRRTGTDSALPLSLILSTPPCPSRPAPPRPTVPQGDTADLVLIGLSIAALVALSMQMYRAWLLYSMFTQEAAMFPGEFPPPGMM